MRCEVGTPCLFCEVPLTKRKDPQWIVDLEGGVVRGLADSTCVRRAKDLGAFEAVRTDFGEEPPGPERIRFARALESLKPKRVEGDEYFVWILATECVWKASNVEEALALPKVRFLLDWWVTGSQIMTQERADRIKQLFTKLVNEELAKI